MARQLTILLFIGLLLASALTVVSTAVQTDKLVRQQFDSLGHQNASLGAQMIEYVVRKSIDNGLFDLRTIFSVDYESIEGSVPPRFHSGYDLYFDRDIAGIQSSFLDADPIFYAYAARADGYVPVHSDATMGKRMLHRAETEGASSAVSTVGRWSDAEGFDHQEYRAPIIVRDRFWGEFRIGIPDSLVVAEVRAQVLLAAAWLVGISVALAAMLYFVVRGKLRPLSDLSRAADEMKRGNWQAEIPTDLQHELGTLATSMDAMRAANGEILEVINAYGENLETLVHQRTSELEQTHEDLVQASRAAGMAEVATGVLHNVGNVLNSVNVSVSVLWHKVERLPVEVLGRALDMVAKYEGDLIRFLDEDPKGDAWLPFLGQIRERMAAAKDSIVEELKGLEGSVEHVKQVISAQQQFASTSGGATEYVNLEEACEAAIAIKFTAQDRNLIEISTDYEDGPTVNVDKHKLMQILVNLVGNAKEALESSDQPTRTLRVRTYVEGDEAARIDVIDNGPGIAVDLIKRVFAYGFTTKPDGHGFGLHSSANSATEMGGQLTAASEGDGAGATFSLCLPIAVPQSV